MPALWRTAAPRRQQKATGYGAHKGDNRWFLVFYLQPPGQGNRPAAGHAKLGAPCAASMRRCRLCFLRRGRLSFGWRGGTVRPAGPRPQKRCTQHIPKGKLQSSQSTPQNAPRFPFLHPSVKGTRAGGQSFQNTGNIYAAGSVFLNGQCTKLDKFADDSRRFCAAAPSGAAR